MGAGRLRSHPHARGGHRRFHESEVTAVLPDSAERAQRIAPIRDRISAWGRLPPASRVRSEITGATVSRSVSAGGLKSPEPTLAPPTHWLHYGQRGRVDLVVQPLRCD